MAAALGFLLLGLIVFIFFTEKEEKQETGQGSAAGVAEDRTWMEGTFTAGGRTYTSEPASWIRTTGWWIVPTGSWEEGSKASGTEPAGNADAGGSSSTGWTQDGRFRYFVNKDGSYGSCVLIRDNDPVITAREDTENAIRLNTDFLDFWKLGHTEIGWVSKGGEQFPLGADNEILKDKVVYDATGRLFRLDKEGRLAGGLVNWNGKTFYFREDGTLCEEEKWIEENGRRYYVSASGEILKNQLIRGDGAYYVDGDGVMVTGFRTVKGKLRYFDADGRMMDSAGWIVDNGKTYYLNNSLDILKDSVEEIDGKRYSFDSDGVLQTGKIKADEESFYYADDSGAFLTDQDFELDGFTFHADADGRVYVGTMFEKAQGYYSDTGYLILCSLATQRTAVFKGSKGKWTLMREMIVSTGAPINPTPKGEYKTTVHTEHFNSYGVRAWYATGFIGGLYLFHSSPYEIDSEPRVCTDDRLGEPHSHGCVRMKLEDAKWMYDNLPLRTKVVIF